MRNLRPIRATAEVRCVARMAVPQTPAARPVRCPLRFLAACAVVAAGLVVSGCMPSTQEAGISDASTSEKSAITSALRATAALEQAGASCRGATEVEDSQAAQAIPNPGAFSVGTCPQFSIDVFSETAAVYTVDVEFGDGCNPAGLDAYECAGSARGALDTANDEFTMTFESLTCDARTLSGAVNVGYASGGDAVELNGDWDLAYVDATRATSVAGVGALSYAATDRQTTISEFSGTLEDGGESYDATITGVVVSVQNNQNLMPSAGEIAIRGSSIRSIRLRFNEASPDTGTFEVSMNDSPYFEASLSDLD